MSGNASFKLFAVLLLSYSSKTSKYKFPSLLSYVYTLITLTGPCAFSSNSSPELFLQGKLTQPLFYFPSPRAPKALSVKAYQKWESLPSYS